MRSDHMLYAVAIICFVITGISFAILVDFERNLSVVTTVIFGILFTGLGFMQRPRPQTATIEVPTFATAPPPQPTAQPEIIVEEKVEATEIVAPSPPAPELTKIKGIGPKRTEQLRALNINTIEELSNASAKSLATRLNISPKITDKWITDAKKRVKS